MPNDDHMFLPFNENDPEEMLLMDVLSNAAIAKQLEKHRSNSISSSSTNTTTTNNYGEAQTVKEEEVNSEESRESDAGKSSKRDEHYEAYRGVRRRP
ncbi:hypothetical protein Syun_029759 [Stephania yunnanensis]|uniref:Uncharacterized protein n=1 Tax=Stephania yunnanensis TaxID=152371 RepID=A0AAP0E8K4_9MAGN